MTATALKTEPKTRLMEMWEQSKDDRNQFLKNNRDIQLPGQWRFIGFGEVTDGYQTVFVTGVVANKPQEGNAMRHIAGALKRRSAGDTIE